MSKVAIVFGVGSRTGYSIAQKFAHEGFKVAIATRSVTDGVTPEGYLAIKTELSETAQIPSIFQTVKEKLGIPSVVIYNAYSTSAPKGNVLNLDTEAAVKDYKANTLSAIAAAKEAVEGFDKLPTEVPKSFIFTGNAQNEITLPVPEILSLGMGKSASAHWIAFSATAFAEKGYGFYYADERTADGKPAAGNISGEAHADFYWELASQGKKEGVPAIATFVKGKGYVDFSKA